MKNKISLICLLAAFSSFSNSSHAQEYDIGVFYMPFWQNNIGPDPFNPTGNWIPYPYFPQASGANQTLTIGGNTVDIQQTILQSNWAMIGNYDTYLVNNGFSGNWDHYSQLSIPKPIWYTDNPDYSGYGFNDSPSYWYNENAPQITSKQAQLMKSYDIDFVIYNWYWNYCECGDPSYLSNPLDPGRWRTYWDAGTRNWLDPSFQDHGLDMAILWSQEFTKLVAPDQNADGSFTGGNPDGADGFFGAGLGLDKMLTEMAKYMNMTGDKYKVKNGKNVLYILWQQLYDLMNAPGVSSHSFFTGHNTNTITRMSHFLNQVNSSLYSKTSKNTYFVAVVSEPYDENDNYDHSGARKKWMIDDPIDGGFDAITSYRYTSHEYNDLYLDAYHTPDWTYDYNRMKSVYNKNYNYYLNTNGARLTSSSTKYQVPVTEGWNKSSYNMETAGLNGTGSPYIWLESHLANKTFAGLEANRFKRHIWDNSNSTPTQYGGALSTAKAWVDSYPSRTDNTVILCCWNEHAEGTVIEPTFAWGYDYLQKIVDVFNPIVEIEDPEPPGPPLQAADSYLGREADEIPAELTIRQNFPNPFRESTSITFGVPADGKVEVQVFDTNKRLVMVLVNETKNAGMHTVEWDASTNKSGIYIGQIIHNGVQKTIKMVLTK